MARVFFICETVIHPTHGYLYPATEDVRNIDNFPCVWHPSLFTDPRRVTIGFAEVTPAQLGLLNADPRIRAILLPDNWEDQAFNGLAVAQQNSILSFMNSRNLDATGIDGALPLAMVVEILGDRIRPGQLGNNLKNLKNQLSDLFGIS